MTCNTTPSKTGASCTDIEKEPLSPGIAITPSIATALWGSSLRFVGKTARFVNLETAADAGYIRVVTCLIGDHRFLRQQR